MVWWLTAELVVRYVLEGISFRVELEGIKLNPIGFLITTISMQIHLSDAKNLQAQGSRVCREGSRGQRPPHSLIP